MMLELFLLFTISSNIQMFRQCFFFVCKFIANPVFQISFRVNLYGANSIGNGVLVYNRIKSAFYNNNAYRVSLLFATIETQDHIARPDVFLLPATVYFHL